MHEIDLRQARACAVELVALRERIFRVGLFKTGHALQAATDAIGYEIADHTAEAERRVREA